MSPQLRLQLQQATEECARPGDSGSGAASLLRLRWLLQAVLRELQEAGE